MSTSPGRTLRRLTCLLALGALLITVPVGVASAGVRQAVPGARYVALGDSFSSGEGLFVYRRGTDTATNRCHRSPLAYGPLLSHARRDVQPFRFAACSGASTADLYAANRRFPGEPAQLSALTRRTRTVTVTIGGNDVGFSQVLGACIRPRATAATPCSADPALTGAVSVATLGLAGQAEVPGTVPIRQVLTDVAARSPRATVYLGGYPELFGDEDAGFARDPAVAGGRSCTLLRTGQPAADLVLDATDARYLNAATRTLNAVLRGAVDQARAAGIRAEFVPATTFEGHGLCDSQRSWINPVLIAPGTITPRSESLHPNLRGSLGYAEVFWAALADGRRLPASVRREAAAG